MGGRGLKRADAGHRGVGQGREQARCRYASLCEVAQEDLPLRLQQTGTHVPLVAMLPLSLAG